MDVIKRKINLLVDLGSYESAISHCTLYISSRNVTNLDNAEVTCILADALIAKHEYRRAISIINAVKNQSAFANIDSNKIERELQAALRLKESICLYKLKEYSNAASCLETIPPIMRTIEMLLLSARIYKANGLKKSQTNIQLEILKLIPCDLEIISELIHAHVSAVDVLNCIENKQHGPLNLEGMLYVLTSDELHQIKLIIHALNAKQLLIYSDCKLHFDKLIHMYPRNTFILKHAGECYVLCGKLQEAYAIFQQLRFIDPCYVHHMDILGYIYYDMNNDYELNRLAMEVMNTIDYSNNKYEETPPEGWILAAMLSSLKNDHDKTILFIEKVFICKCDLCTLILHTIACNRQLH